jgi:hypothetical protein
MMFWLIVLAVVVVLAALAWWTSGRMKPGGPNSERVSQGSAKSQGRVGMQSGRNLGQPPTGPTSGGGSS